MNFKSIGIPTIKLLVIAAVITILLFLTNNTTEAKIAQNQADANVASRKEVLPDADDFDEKTVTVDGVEYTYYEAKNGAGYVFSGSNKGYGGAVVSMVGGLVAALSLAQPHAGPKEALDFIHRVHASVDRPANFASCDLFTAANNDIIIGTRLKFSQMIGLIRNGTHRIIFPPQMRFRYHLALPLSLAKNRAFPVMLAGTFIVKIGVRS